MGLIYHFQLFLQMIFVFVYELEIVNMLVIQVKNLKQFQYYYKRKFNKNIKLRYFIGFMENIEDNIIYLYEYENQDFLSRISHQTIKEISRLMTIKEFNAEFEKNSMNYINFFPDIFEDAGRKFASENNLVKSENSYK